METIWASLFNGLAVFLGVFLGLRLNAKVSDAREKGETLLPPAIAHALTPQAQKAEFLPPMNEEEYEDYMDETSGHGELAQSVLAKMPWNSGRQKSPSSDSSSKTE